MTEEENQVVIILRKKVTTEEFDDFFAWVAVRESMSSTTLRDFTRRKTLKIIVARHFSSTLLRLNKTIKGAPKLLQNSYENLYVLAKTQKAYANERNVTEKYIQILHKRMLVYLFNSLNKEQE